MIFPVRLSLDGRSIAFELDLDGEFTSDCWILDSFQRKIVYEQEAAWVMRRCLREGDTAIDVGANVGYFTFLMASLVGPTGKVIGFEPSNQNYPKLVKNATLNTFENIALCEIALSDRQETVSFFLNEDNSGGDCLWNPANWHENKKSQKLIQVTELMTQTLDSLHWETKPRLIKIDTEGAEQKILDGATHILRWDKPPFVICELNEFGLQQMGGSVNELRRMMQGHGYDTFLLYADGQLPKLVPRSYGFVPPHVMNVLFSTPDDVGRAWEGCGA